MGVMRTPHNTVRMLADSSLGNFRVRVMVLTLLTILAAAPISAASVHRTHGTPSGVLDAAAAVTLSESASAPRYFTVPLQRRVSSSSEPRPIHTKSPSAKAREQRWRSLAQMREGTTATCPGVCQAPTAHCGQTIIHGVCPGASLCCPGAGGSATPATPTPPAHASNTKDTGSALVYACSEILVPVKIGSQDFILNLDTGSSTVAVASTSCASCHAQLVTPLYTHAAPAVATGQRASISYEGGDGLSGPVFTDHVQMFSPVNGGLAPAPVAMRLIAADTQNAFFDTCRSDNGKSNGLNGIIGVSMDGSDVDGTDDYFSMVIKNNPTVPKQFTLQLCPSDLMLYLGEAPNAAPSTWAPLLGTTDWALDVAAIRLGKATVGTPFPVSVGDENSDKVYSIVDSGTTDWSLPSATYDLVLHSLSANKVFHEIFPTSASYGECRLLPAGMTLAQVDAAMPTLGVQFRGGAVFDLPASRTYLSFCTGGKYVSLGLERADNSSPGEHILGPYTRYVECQLVKCVLSCTTY